MSGHTPGPWTFERGLDNQTIQEGEPVLGSIMGNRFHIARVWSDVYDDEAEANARLIAAAPDLLVALKELLLCSDECELILRKAHPNKAQSLRARVTDARAAIKQATEGA